MPEPPTVFANEWDAERGVVFRISEVSGLLLFLGGLGLGFGVWSWVLLLVLYGFVCVCLFH